MKVEKASNPALNEALPKQSPLTTSEHGSQSEFVNSKASMAARAYAMPQIKSSKKVSFEGKWEKNLDLIKNAVNPNKVHLSYEDICGLLERHLGYNIRNGAGSHSVACKPGCPVVTIVHPHGHNKFVDPGTIKDLRNIITSNYAVSGHATA